MGFIKININNHPNHQELILNLIIQLLILTKLKPLAMINVHYKNSYHPLTLKAFITISIPGTWIGFKIQYTAFIQLKIL